MVTDVNVNRVTVVEKDYNLYVQNSYKHYQCRPENIFVFVYNFICQFLCENLA